MNSEKAIDFCPLDCEFLSKPTIEDSTGKCEVYYCSSLEAIINVFSKGDLMPLQACRGKKYRKKKIE